jgi:tRNA(Arg) A34 adenosine deaminase TadA
MKSVMQSALNIATLSGPDIPIGCIIIRNGSIIASAHNEVELLSDPTAHAEILCIRRACGILGVRNLEHCTLVCTLEPCPMCLEAIKLARIKHLIFGAFQDYSPTVDLDVIGGIMEDECSKLIKQYFIKIRTK